MKNKTNFVDTILLINKEGMGIGDQFLTQKLLDTYLRLLLENETLPEAICFYTEGVKLVVSGSPLLDRLSQLEQAGVRLIICSTCLNFYGLNEAVKVGIIGGMPDIIEAQASASKVITL